MYLLEPGLDIGCNHRLRPHHRVFCRKFPPWIGTEMVAAKNDALNRKTYIGGYAFDKRSKIRGLHPGVATFPD